MLRSLLVVFVLSAVEASSKYEVAVYSNASIVDTLLMPKDTVFTEETKAPKHIPRIPYKATRQETVAWEKIYTYLAILFVTAFVVVFAVDVAFGGPIFGEVAEAVEPHDETQKRGRKLVVMNQSTAAVRGEAEAVEKSKQKMGRKLVLANLQEPDAEC